MRIDRRATRVDDDDDDDDAHDTGRTPLIRYRCAGRHFIPRRASVPTFRRRVRRRVVTSARVNDCRGRRVSVVRGHDAPAAGRTEFHRPNRGRRRLDTWTSRRGDGRFSDFLDLLTTSAPGTPTSIRYKFAVY